MEILEIINCFKVLTMIHRSQILIVKKIKGQLLNLFMYFIRGRTLERKRSTKQKSSYYC